MGQYPIRLYLDECVHAQAAAAFRDVGFKAFGAHELRHFKLDDPEQLRFAAQEGMAILTYNVCDFVPLHQQWQADGLEHSGIILSPKDYKQAVGHLVRDLRATLKAGTEMRGVPMDQWVKNEMIWIQKASN